MTVNKTAKEKINRESKASTNENKGVATNKGKEETSFTFKDNQTPQKNW